MVYYFKGRKLQIGFSTHETNNEKVVSTHIWVLDGVSILIPDGDSETIDTANGVDVLRDHWIIILECDRRSTFTHQTRKRISQHTHRRLTFIDIRSSVTEDGVEFTDGHVTMFSRNIGIDSSSEKSRLNNIF